MSATAAIFQKILISQWLNLQLWLGPAKAHLQHRMRSDRPQHTQFETRFSCMDALEVGVAG